MYNYYMYIYFLSCAYGALVTCAFVNVISRDDTLRNLCVITQIYRTQM